MNLYSVKACNDADYHILVVAESAGRAKAQAWESWFKYEHEDYILLRVRLLERDVPYEPKVYDGDDQTWTPKWYCRREFATCHCFWCDRERIEEAEQMVEEKLIKLPRGGIKRKFDKRALKIQMMVDAVIDQYGGPEAAVATLESQLATVRANPRQYPNTSIPATQELIEEIRGRIQ